jgi:DUF971 family protein
MQPTDIRLHKKTALLELHYADGGIYSLPAEFLRVHSPSAEVRGHGKGQEVLQVEKMHVKIDKIDPVGHYAVQLHFSDSHSTGIYSWDYLRELALNQQTLWNEYLERLKAAGARREPPEAGVQVVNIVPLKPH